jgi:hypothetical protein
MTTVAAYFERGVALALELANTASEHRRGQDAVFSADRVSRTARVADPRVLARFAVKLRAVLEADEPRQAGPLINELLDTYSARPVLTPDKQGDWRLHLHSPDADLEARDIVKAASGLAALIDDGRWHDLKQCASKACDDYFLDESRNKSRRYCSRSCANQVSARAHRERQSRG